MSEKIKISLVNCDFNKKKIRITSPYSLKACELIGVDAEDLQYIPKEDYILKNQEFHYLNKDFQEERYNHFNNRRLKLIEEAKNKRKELIENDKNIVHSNEEININNYNYINNVNNNVNNNDNKDEGYSTFYSQNHLKKSSSTGMLNVKKTNRWRGASTAIKEERERLKKLKERQEINIKLQIDYECAKEETRRKNILKMKLNEEKEERKKIEKNKKLKEKLRKEEEKEKSRKKKEEEYNNKIEEKRKKEEKKEK